MMKFVIFLLVSMLMGMGVGGGGLLVIYLALCLNLPQLSAQGTNLFLFLIAGIASLIFHLRKRKIKLLQVVNMIAFGSVGSVIFSKLSVATDPKYARIGLGVLLIISGFLTIYKSFIKELVKKFKKTLYK